MKHKERTAGYTPLVEGGTIRVTPTTYENKPVKILRQASKVLAEKARSKDLPKSSKDLLKKCSRRLRLAKNPIKLHSGGTVYDVNDKAPKINIHLETIDNKQPIQTTGKKKSR
ncbi:MAG: hypothetical protein IKL33_01355 [Alphaproteobacteria bacterium]|nr:hypothetical protein [Alphaproteobacteria bacterium]